MGRAVEAVEFKLKMPDPDTADNTTHSFNHPFVLTDYVIAWELCPGKNLNLGEVPSGSRSRYVGGTILQEGRFLYDQYGTKASMTLFHVTRSDCVLSSHSYFPFSPFPSDLRRRKVFGNPPVASSPTQLLCIYRPFHLP